MSKAYDARQAAIQAHPNDQSAGVDLFLGFLDVSGSDFEYEFNQTAEQYIYGDQLTPKNDSENKVLHASLSLAQGDIKSALAKTDDETRGIYGVLLMQAAALEAVEHLPREGAQAMVTEFREFLNTLEASL